MGISPVLFFPWLMGFVRIAYIMGLAESGDKVR